jgi:hypothetical protein
MIPISDGFVLNANSAMDGGPAKLKHHQSGLDRAARPLSNGMRRQPCGG